MPKPSTGHDRRLRWGDGWIEERMTASGEPRWLARWREPIGTGDSRIVSRSFLSVTAAETHLRAVADKVERGSYVVPERLTVGDLVERWIERGAGEWSASTSANYASWARMGILPDLGAVKVSVLDAPRVQHWVDGLAGRLSPGSIHDVVFVLRSAFKDAVRLGIVATNPVTGTRVPTNRAKKPKTWTAAEAQMVIAAVADDPMWHAAFRLHLATGMRPGEIRALRWSDLSLTASTITVSRTMSQDEDRKVIVGDRTKTGRVRAIALSGSTVAALTAWRKIQVAIRLAAPAWHDLDAMFSTHEGQHLSQSRWGAYLVDVIRRTGVTAITPHGIRHTAATLMLEQGVHPKVVADILGHSSVLITLDRYSHVSAELQRTAIERLASVFDPIENREAQPG